MSRRLTLTVLSGGLLVAGAFAWSCGGGEDTTDAGNDGSADTSNPDTSKPETGSDGATDAGTDGSDGAVGPRCTTSKPFGAITLVAELGGADAGSSGARLTNDSLTVFYAANPTAALNGTIETATRDASTSTFGASTALTTLADAAVQGLDPSISPDGLTLYAQFNPSNFVEIVYGTRANTSANWNYSTGITNLSGSAPNHGAPYLQGDNSTLWYAARVAPDGGATQGGGSLDIFKGDVTGAGQLANLTGVNEVNTTFDETSVAITSNGLSIYFARKEATDGGASGTFHVFSTTRAATTDPFPAPTLVQELDDMPTTNTSPTWVSPDNCVIYLQSDRGGPAGGIYVATRPL